jgi:two-component system, chemotaxis family, chemotaxis protein CheY
MSKTVMVVDDSPVMRQLICSALEQAGYEILDAEDGQFALEKLKDTPVQLVISDLNMPNMNGIELIKELRAHPSHKYTPIIMLTTESQMSRVKEGKAAGATGWIVKPFDPEHLVNVVNKVLG